MRKAPQNPPAPWQVVIVSAVVTMTLWAAWLGWDQHRDVHPDGSETGPYEAWQVIGLVLSLLTLLYAAVRFDRATPAAKGITGGLTVAAFYDWSGDDGSGLFVVGVAMIMIAALVTSATLAHLLTALESRRRRSSPE